MATLADLLGDRPPHDAGENSESFRSALLDEPCDGCGRRGLVHHSTAGTFAIRQGNWKLVAGRGSGGFTKRSKEVSKASGQLYNLAEDPHETKNPYDVHPGIVERLGALLERRRES